MCYSEDGFEECCPRGYFASPCACGYIESNARSRWVITPIWCHSSDKEFNFGKLSVQNCEFLGILLHADCFYNKLIPAVVDDPIKSEWLRHSKGITGSQKISWHCCLCCIVANVKKEFEYPDVSQYAEEYAIHLSTMPGSDGAMRAQLDFEKLAAKPPTTSMDDDSGSLDSD